MGSIGKTGFMNKKAEYSELARCRHSCAECGPAYVRSLGYCDNYEFGSQHIGPWTGWQGNLDAELVIIGQEWGGARNYVDQKGCDLDRDPTNANLAQLVGSISGPIGSLADWSTIPISTPRRSLQRTSLLHKRAALPQAGRCQQQWRPTRSCRELLQPML